MVEAPEASIYLTIAWKPTKRTRRRQKFPSAKPAFLKSRTCSVSARYLVITKATRLATPTPPRRTKTTELETRSAAAAARPRATSRVTFVMASVVGDDHDDDGMGSDEEHEEYDAE